MELQPSHNTSPCRWGTPGIPKPVRVPPIFSPLADPSELSGICLYLASDDASFRTGAVFLVDGGASIVDVGRVAIASALRQKTDGEA